MSHIFAYSNGEGAFFNENLNKVSKNTFSGITFNSNNEQFMSLKNKGPIPVGTYTVSSISNGIATLTPDEDVDLMGREKFMIHTAKSINDHTADGCIITSQTMMDNIYQGDTILVTNEMNQIPALEEEGEEEKTDDN